MSPRSLLVNPPVLAADAHQVDLYAEAIPFGLLQIATHLSERGHDVTLLDLMEYRDGNFDEALSVSRHWGLKPLGDRTVRLRRPVYRVGRSLEWLEGRLAALPAPDEILVTCCIPFNNEPAHAVVSLCKKFFPSARIRFGGFYPSAFPEHAGRSGADEVFIGRHHEADRVLPRLDLLEEKPKIWLFRLASGCQYRCSYCLNASDGDGVVLEPEAVAREVVRVHETYGIGTFSNWDPNVMLHGEVLERFLDEMIALGSPVRLKLEMGVQPDLLTPALARKMKEAGVEAMTIPFESADPAMMRRFGKPYRMSDAMDAVAICRDLGFPTGIFHCPWVVGFRGESFLHVFRTYFGVLKAGGLPTPFPLSPVPGTREYDRHAPYLAGKDLSELNGHLWPALPSAAHVVLYDRIYEVIRQPDAAGAARLARGLPATVRTAFEAELAWYLEGPHEPARRASG